jgi:hypothetical protein
MAPTVEPVTAPSETIKPLGLMLFPMNAPATAKLTNPTVGPIFHPGFDARKVETRARGTPDVPA